MKKRLFSIWSVLLVLVISIAVLIPGCAGGQCSIEVKATYCGAPYPGAVSYTLATPGTSVNGTSVPATHSVGAGTWTCSNVSGGPPGTFLNIAPSATQTVSDGGTITFTLEFEKEQDAAIECLTWTIDGVPIEEWQGTKYYNEMEDAWEVWPSLCSIIDVHFKQWVDGCQGYNVTLNETSWLKITETGGALAKVFVSNSSCAVNKTSPPQGPSPNKVSQVTTIGENPVEPGTNITLSLDEEVSLDVETVWELVKCFNYTKSINWLGISTVAQYEQSGPHPCVLFELGLPIAGWYYFTLEASAEVALVNDVDVDPTNNKATCSDRLYVTVYVPP